MVRRDEAERRSTCHSGAAPTCRSSHCQRNSASEAFRNKKHMKRKKRRLTGLTPSSVKSNRENGFPITEGASGNSTGMERRHTISERTYRHALPKIRSLRPADHAVLPVHPGEIVFKALRHSIRDRNRFHGNSPVCLFKKKRKPVRGRTFPDETRPAEPFPIVPSVRAGPAGPARG